MNYRDLFVGVDEYMLLDKGEWIIPINFDNGATTPPMVSAVNEINRNLKYYSSIGRGTSQKCIYCTNTFEAARSDILKFFSLEPSGDHTVIYVKSTTEGLNLLANVLANNKNDIILTTRMEHHANDLPWRYSKAKVDYVDVDKNGRILIRDIENKLLKYKGKIKYVAITAASNVTGYVNDINKIANICHKYGAKIIVDAAQLVAHREINMLGNMKSEEIDFLVFSAHKAYAPFDGGVIVGLKHVLENVVPFLKGGGAVWQVFDDSESWNDVPEKFEAGTQNFFGVISMAVSLKNLKYVGFNNIMNHENDIKNYLIHNMKKMPHIILYGDTENTVDRLGVITFNIVGKDHEEVAERLSNDIGLASRSGKFCAHPYVTRLLGIKNTPKYKSVQDDCGMVRISLGLYNTIEEAKRFIEYIKNLK